MRTVSIAMTYWERPVQLKNTLDSIQHFNNVSPHILKEVVIVDDESLNCPLSSLTLDNYSFKIIKLKIENKTHINPCVAYNMAFNHTSGDIVLIQNSECFHFSNLLEYLGNHFELNSYVSFGCYSLSKETSETFVEKIKNSQLAFFDRPVTADGQDGWYNHSLHRPKYYHFASAISKSNLTRMGGFDPRFAQGYGFDDDEFVFRIARYKIKMVILDTLIVLHQWHPASSKIANLEYLKSRNEKLYNVVTLRESDNKLDNFKISILFFLVELKLKLRFKVLYLKELFK